MSPSDDLPYWSREDLREAEYDYMDLLERLELKYRLVQDSFDADDLEYPPICWEAGL